MKELKATTRLSCKELEQQGQYEVWEKTNQVHSRHRLRRYIVITDLTQGEKIIAAYVANSTRMESFALISSKY